MRAFVVLLLLVMMGCGEADKSYRAEGEFPAPAKAPAVAEGGAQQAQGAGQGQPQAASAVQRQIIYRANVSLVVEALEPLADKVEKLAATHNGFVSNSGISGAAGSSRSGNWTLRVPSDKYPAIVEAIRKLGEVTQLDSNSEDVSAEYYDVEARIRNRKAEESRLLKILDEQTGKLEDVLLVEKELSRVREDIERMQGRLNVLKDLVSLSTVTIHAREIRGYVPPQSPTLALRVSRAWTESLSALQKVGEGLLIAAVAITPWAAILSIPLLIIYVTLRRAKRST